MDDRAHFEILPIDLLRRGFYVGERLCVAPDEDDHEEQGDVLRAPGDRHAQIVKLNRVLPFLLCRRMFFARSAGKNRLTAKDAEDFEGRGETLTARSSMLRRWSCLIDAQVGAAEGGDLKVMRSVDD
jgi:hypothetical protein